MKRIFYVLFVAALALATVLGCGGTPPAATPAPAPVQAAPVPSNVPDWYINEFPPEDVFWGVGQAKLQNESLAIQTATSRARRDVAAQVSVMTQGMLTDYAREAGSLNQSASSQFIESVGRDLINANLSGAVPNARAKMPDGTWWIRVELKKADARKAITDVVDNEQARFAEFKAQEALKMLDSKLADTKSKPTARAED